MYKIYTVDDNSDIIIGNIEVVDRDNLKKFRDELIQSFVSKTRCKLITLADLYRPGLYYDSNNKVVKERHRSEISKFESDSEIVYDEVTYYNRFINSIMIFTSLLGELNINNFDNYLTKYLIMNGLFKYESFDKVWDKYSSIIIGKEQKSNEKYGDDVHCYDYGALRFAMDNGFIKYNIIDKIPFRSSNDKMIKNISYRDIEQIMCNSKLLLNNDKKGKKKVIMR